MRIIIEIAESSQAAPIIAVTGTAASAPQAEGAIAAAPQAAGIRAARAAAIDAGPAPVRGGLGVHSVEEAGASPSLGRETDALPAGSAPALG